MLGEAVETDAGSSREQNTVHHEEDREESWHAVLDHFDSGGFFRTGKSSFNDVTCGFYTKLRRFSTRR